MLLKERFDRPPIRRLRSRCYRSTHLTEGHKATQQGWTANHHRHHAHDSAHMRLTFTVRIPH
jgi:hypothetical protein